MKGGDVVIEWGCERADTAVEIIVALLEHFGMQKPWFSDQVHSLKPDYTDVCE